MAHLIYTANSSLDGYIKDRDGKFDWTAPDEEYFRFTLHRTGHELHPDDWAVIIEAIQQHTAS